MVAVAGVGPGGAAPRREERDGFPGPEAPAQLRDPDGDGDRERGDPLAPAEGGDELGDGAFGHGLSNFGRAWTNLPVWDRDEAYHYWFGDPYAGAFYYNMMRSQGATVGQSFAYCAFQSMVWEYVLEAAAEQPSIQDLVSTPIMGAALGELFHRWSIAILRKGKLSFGEKALVFLLNPSYVINNGYRAPE